MHPYPGPSQYPQQGFGQPPPGGPPASNPFAAAPQAGGGVISSPFGGAPVSAPPPAGGPPLGGPPGGGPPLGGPPPGGPPPGGPPPGGAPPTSWGGAPPYTGGVAPPTSSPYPSADHGPPPPGAAGYPSGAGYPTSSPNTRHAGPAFYPQPDQGGHGHAGQPGVGPPQHDAYSVAVAKDLEQCNSPAHFVRATVSRFPNSVSSKQKTTVPLGIVLQPLAPTPPGEEEVPSVNFGTVGTIVRCKQCRTYVNPFVQWEANGRRWTCNLCGFSQMTPESYFSSLDESGKRMDRYQRPELCKGAVEYIAPGEYMVRPPQPPVFMFVLDVSYTSVVTGVLDSAVAAIKECIESGRMPGGSRAQVGIITFDTSVHFYNLNSNLQQPQMLVVADLEDLFLPLPDDILVHVSDNELAIMTLLDSLPSLFRDTKVNESCMGSAVKGAFMAMKHIGGKMLVVGACIPSVGELSLKSTRDNPKLLGTEREVELLRPVSDGYKDLATDLTRAQISVEMFFAPQQYIDLASIQLLAKYTGGDVRYYPQFHISHSGTKLKTELTHVLTRYMGWEAVMRVRVSRGWNITKFYGHLFLRGQDLLVVPNCHSDQTFAISVDMQENVTPDPVLCVQSALLYTNSDGERRIRVHTWASLTTQNYADIIGSVDVMATTAMLSQISMEQSLKVNMAEGRNRLQTQCQQIVQASNVCPQAEALQFLPLYIMGMLKSQAFRSTTDISADMRAYIWSRLETLSVSQMSAYYYPRMMALHNAPEACATPDETDRIVLPDMLNLTSESMTQDGVFLLEDGDVMQIWIGSQTDGNFLSSVFGVHAFDQLDTNTLGMTLEESLLQRQNPSSRKVLNILRQVRLERPVPHMQLFITRQGEPKEAKFFASLIEDRTIGLQRTYAEFLQLMGHRPQPQQQSAPPGGPPGAAGWR